MYVCSTPVQYSYLSTRVGNSLFRSILLFVLLLKIAQKTDERIPNPAVYPLCILYPQILYICMSALVLMYCSVLYLCAFVKLIFVIRYPCILFLFVTVCLQYMHSYFFFSLRFSMYIVGILPCVHST